jgi:glycerol uptake operon antiterminator
MATTRRIPQCFAKPVIPVISELPASIQELAQASCVILQGGNLVDLPALVSRFERAPLKDVCVFVHIDLIVGLENNEAGVDFLAQLPRIDGIVTVHQHLIPAIKKIEKLAVSRLFLSDSRALERGLRTISKCSPDVVDLLPAAAAVRLADDFRDCVAPRIAGGLCRTKAEVQEVLESSCLAVTSTLPSLWRLNAPGAS